MLRQWPPGAATLAVSARREAVGAEPGSTHAVAWAHDTKPGTLREAAEVAGGVRVATSGDAANDEFDIVPPDRNPTSSMVSSTTGGIDYAGSCSAGAVYLRAIPNSVGCSTGLSYHVNTMPATWDNRVSSTIAVGGWGAFIHCSGIYQTGSSISCPCPSSEDLRWDGPRSSSAGD